MNLTAPPAWAFACHLQSRTVFRSAALFLVLANVPVAAWAQEATSREVSVFNFGASAAAQEAISREVSVFNFGLASSAAEAVSREVSLFNFGLSAASNEALSREVSVFNFGFATAAEEAVSREVSVFNFGLASAGVEATSRELSVFNFGSSSAPIEAISREVSVMNYGVPAVIFSVGATNILRDEINRVPFELETILDLTNLSLTLVADDSHLSVLSVTPASPEAASVFLGKPDTNRHSISFALNPGNIPATNHTLAYLNFQGITNLDSAVVNLYVTSLTAFRANGQAVPCRAADGRVIIIVTRPILFPGSHLPFGFTMYGIPGKDYSFQSTTNLVPSDWMELEHLTQLGSTVTLAALSNSAPQQFYRAVQVQAGP